MGVRNYLLTAVILQVCPRVPTHKVAWVFRGEGLCLVEGGVVEDGEDGTHVLIENIWVYMFFLVERWVGSKRNRFF